ncbi:MAG: FAD-linked oxidase C-terminal domain-containing protein [Bacteroidota bacterium]|nr:FAD-linked oxidase C-terminal domain-containing protein [Bacteroidota bacterium]
MAISNTQYPFETLKNSIKGECADDITYRRLYATDASAYREMPVAVVWPKDKQDIHAVIDFCRKHKLPVIPRGAGTSLAGQVVGNGLVVDISRHMKSIIEYRPEEKWIKVEPGVVRDELNAFTAADDLFFGPETSTSNRANIAGMVGNNSCGARSLIYGSTRDHCLEIDAILSDGSEVTFKPLTPDEFNSKCNQQNKEGEIYRQLKTALSDKLVQQKMQAQLPDPAIKRRNTGYAIDVLFNTSVFGKSDKPLNLSSLICGSEGTLAFITAVKLNLEPLPPAQNALVCVHTHSLDEAFRANLIALKYKPSSIELMDDQILELSKHNREQEKNRFFVKGNPKAILIVEFARDTMEEIETLAENMKKDMGQQGLGYSFPVIKGDDTKRVWDLRKAGLGILYNMPGDTKPVPVIEDTAVKPEVLPDYMADFSKLIDKHQLKCIYYAHIDTGELHLRPLLNLKDPADVEMYHTIALETAKLVKKHKGSLSGEHGDGRLRGEFIPMMVGDTLYNVFKELKSVWDPDALFNPHKITDTPPMNEQLRFKPGSPTRKIDTVFDFSGDGGILRSAEKCSGSGDCRKTQSMGGTMCPSFMATGDEKNSTRARANSLREILTNNTGDNPFDSKELFDVLDNCLMCKACKSECPSSVDVAKMKMEFLQHYYDAHGIPLRTRLIAYLPVFHKFGAVVPGIFNFFVKNKFTSAWIKRIIRFAPQRQIPQLSGQRFSKLIKTYIHNMQPDEKRGKIFLLKDEFTNYLDTNTGIAAIRFFTQLGYEVVIPKTKESARTWLSKGLIRTAKKIINTNIRSLKDIVSEETPLVGIEPSAILGFRDEYPDLADNDLKTAAKHLSQHAYMFEEFVAREIDAGRITKDDFTTEPLHIKFHGHCQQKAIAGTEATKKTLGCPENYEVEEIPSGCCGMAGSFGYEKEHYDLSMKIGEMVLFPEIRKATPETVIVASGTSCRCHIKDGTNTNVLHPAEVMLKALKKP